MALRYPRLPARARRAQVATDLPKAPRSEPTMSIRTDTAAIAAAHVCVRGTHISTCRRNPSRLHRDVLKEFGCPNANGYCHVDGVRVHILFNTASESEVAAWAETDADAGAWCVVA